MNKEIEVDFIEPLLSIAIVNLGIIEEEFGHKKIDYKKLSKLLDDLNDVEDLEELRSLFTDLQNSELEIRTLISDLDSENQFSLVLSLQIAIQAGRYIDSNEFLFKHLADVETLIKEKKIISYQQVFENYKVLILEKIHVQYKQILEDFKKSPAQDEEIIKVFELLCHERNFEDLKEGSLILLDFLQINYKPDGLVCNKQLVELVKSDLLISLVELWNEFGIEN